MINLTYGLCCNKSYFELVNGESNAFEVNNTLWGNIDYTKIFENIDPTDPISIQSNFDNLVSSYFQSKNKKRFGEYILKESRAILKSKLLSIISSSVPQSL